MENRGIKGKVQILAVTGYLAAVVLIIYMGIVSCNHYREELIAAEQNELLMMAETIGQSLVSYVEQELESMDLCCTMLEASGQGRNKKSIEIISENYLEKKGNLYKAAAYVDNRGDLDVLCGNMEEFSLAMLSDEGGAMICGKGLTASDGYQLYLARKFFLGEEPGYLVYAMDLDEIYRKIVAPVHIGKGGYSIVKDRDLSIIMHHAQNQIGMDAVYDRSERYPDLDLDDLSAWVELQRNQPEGVGMIHTYVWDDPELAPVERIVAYTTIQLPGETWIVNSTIPYKEIEGPFWLMLQRLMGICLVFIGCLSVSIVIFTRDLMRSRSQKKEINYLREINEGMELLRRKEEEIQHYQRVQTIGQMSSHIAHEFNNYLTPVMVYAELLEGDEAIGAENRKLVQGILKSTNQAADLSRKLLDFSRQETSVLLTRINFTQDVEAALHMIRQLAPQKISVESDIEEQPFYIRGRKGMVEHILMNLCNNAFHAMEEKGGRLTVRLALAQNYSAGVQAVDIQADSVRAVCISPGDVHELSQGEWVVLSVCDTGCGMGKDVLEKIFEPFYTTKRQGKGTGLGLSVIRNIVSSVQGVIRVCSEEGKGTGFYLFFPVLAENEREKEEETERKEETEKKEKGAGDEEETGSARNKTPVNHRVKRVVIVDDDPELLESLRKLFCSLDCRCEGFKHPAAVISKIQKHPDYCDLILTDYSMPYMNGVELCELVRKFNPHIRLVLMSGAADTRFEWYRKNAFIDGYVLKTDLAKQLGGMLDGSFFSGKP